MFSKSSWKSGFAVVMAVGITTGSIAPLVTATPVFAQSNFSDVKSNYWAGKFIQELAKRDVIAGFPDGSFRPEQAVTRAQFAAMIRKAFRKAPERRAIDFKDVSRDFWGYRAIRRAYRTGFLSGYPGNRFEPNQNIPREQVLVSLANGLDYSPTRNTNRTLRRFYTDSASISNYARSPIAAATEKQIVVNYPNVASLRPKATATRAQVAAFIYQALVSQNQAPAISSPYIVSARPRGNRFNLPQGTAIQVKYDKAEKILVTKDETAPLTLTVSQNVRNNRGNVVIPAGSKVVGELRPVAAKGGSQFVAQKLILASGQEYSISATSEVITKTETVKKGVSLGTTLKNAALGAAAAAAIAAVTGDRAIATEEVLGGAAVASLLSLFLGKKSVDLIVIDPNTDLKITTNKPLRI